MELAAGGDVEVEPLLVGQAGHRPAQERLRRVGGAVGEGGGGLPAAGPQVRLVVDEQRRAELGDEVLRWSSRRSRATRRRRRRRCPAAGPTAAAGHRARSTLRGPAPSGSGADTPSRSSPMARPTRAASTSHSRAWVSSGGTLGATRSSRGRSRGTVGELAHPGRDLVRRPLVAGQLDRSSGSCRACAAARAPARARAARGRRRRAGRARRPRSAATPAIEAIRA